MKYILKLLPFLGWSFTLLFLDGDLKHRLAFFFGMYMLSIGIWESYGFRNDRKISWYVYFFIGLNILISLLILFTPLFISGDSNGSPLFSNIASIFHVYLIFNIVLVLINFISSYLEKNKEHYKYLISLVLILVPIGFVTNFLLPLNGNREYVFIGSLIPLFLVILVLYLKVRVRVYMFNYIIYLIFPYLLFSLGSFLVIFVSIVTFKDVLDPIFTSILILLFVVLIYILSRSLSKKVFQNIYLLEKETLVKIEKMISTKSIVKLEKIYIESFRRYVPGCITYKKDEKEYFLYSTGLSIKDVEMKNINETELLVHIPKVMVVVLRDEIFGKYISKEKLVYIENLSKSFLLNHRRIGLLNKLEEENVSLEEISKMKDDFASLTSHQLKTPLTIVKGYIDLISGEVKSKEILQRLYIQLNSLLEISENILLSIKIGSNKLSSDKEEINLVDVCKEIYSKLLSKVNQGKIKFDLVEESKEFKVIGNMYELKQALTNIIDNSINYTREGYIRITIKSKSIQVSDSGIGISKEDLKKIFNQYYRSENAKELKPNGSGIGLYISKKIFERSKLKLTVTSEIGVGTTFSIS